MADYIVVADKNLPALNEKINLAAADGLMPVGEPVYAYGVFVQPCARMSAFPYTPGSQQSIIGDRDVNSLAARVQALAGTGVSPSGGMQAFEGLFLQRMGMPESMGADAPVEITSAEGWVQWRRQGEDAWRRLYSLDSVNAEPNILSVGSVNTMPAGSDAEVHILGETPNQEINFGIPRGEAGEKGDTGERGQQGLPGEKGEKGDRGEAGPAGPKGEKGEKGDTGQQGAQGEKGSKGDTGAAGSPGSAGPKGEKGDRGDSGPQGLKGDTGATGPTGPKGDKGDTGAQGPAGSSAVNPTPLNYETITVTARTAGAKVPVTFSKPYAVPPEVIGVIGWTGSQVVFGFASDITTTGCNVVVVQSRGTLLLTTGSFENAPAGTTCRMTVLGTGA